MSFKYKTMDVIADVVMCRTIEKELSEEELDKRLLDLANRTQFDEQPEDELWIDEYDMSDVLDYDDSDAEKVYEEWESLPDTCKLRNEDTNGEYYNETAKHLKQYCLSHGWRYEDGIFKKKK